LQFQACGSTSSASNASHQPLLKPRFGLKDGASEADETEKVLLPLLLSVRHHHCHHHR
jgi:hypothetical protein